MRFPGPTWRKPGQEFVLLASRRYDGSTSRKTKGSMADTLQCNLWRRAQTPGRMTHSLHGGNDSGHSNGFTALVKTIGTNKSTPKDSEYVEEHSVLTHLLVHYQYGMKRVIRIRDRWGPQPWQSLPLAVQGQGLYWRNPYTEAPSSIQDTASLRFSFGGQQLLVLACSCSLVSLPSMRTPAPPSCR